MLMATALMQCDQMAINRINPFTATESFGVNFDGFPKNIHMDGSYITEIDPTPMEESGRPELDGEMNFNFSGPMYLKTSDTSPAPFRPFPARKYEYADGTTTWDRPYLPWSWEGKGKSQSSMDRESITFFIVNNSLLFLIIFIVLVLYLSSKKF